MQKYIEQTTKQEVVNWLNSNLNNYLKKHEENIGEIEHIIDFFNSEESPKRLKRVSYPQAKVAAQKWIEHLKSKAQFIEEVSEDLEIIYTFKNNYRIVRLKGKNAFEREGNLMSHCVASYFGKKDVFIYSLRDDNNAPHCTIEVVRSGNTINQIKGKGNGSIHPKYISYVLTFLKSLGLSIRSSELENLGYVEITEQLVLELKNSFRNVQTLKYKDKYYLFLKGKKLIKKV